MPEVDYLPAVFSSMLREAGLTTAGLHRIFIQNPAETFALTGPAGRVQQRFPEKVQLL